MKLEMMIGGLLALFVLVAAFVSASSFAPAGAGSAQTGAALSPSPTLSAPVADGDLLAGEFTHFERIEADPRCQCYMQGFALAGTGVDVSSAQFRAGYKQCRALSDPKAGNAWTDGWNARLSSSDGQVGCPAYFRREKISLD